MRSPCPAAPRRTARGAFVCRAVTVAPAHERSAAVQRRQQEGPRMSPTLRRGEHSVLSDRRTCEMTMTEYDETLPDTGMMTGSDAGDPGDRLPAPPPRPAGRGPAGGARAPPPARPRGP